jgi:hypothetical protein
MLRKFGEWAKTLICLGVLWRICSLITIAFFALIGVITMMVTGQTEDLPGQLAMIGAISLLFLFGAWVAQDARRSAQELHRHDEGVQKETNERSRSE